MKNRYGITTFIFAIVIFNIVFNIFEDGNSFGIPSFLWVFVIFGIFSNVIARANKNKPKQRKSESEGNSAPQWTNIEQQTTSTYDYHECEYCGHTNHSSREYCENCGAKQLPQ